MKRMVVLVAFTGGLLLLSSAVALAAINSIECPGGECLGTEGDDSMNGTDAYDQMYGLGGNDNMFGHFGNDDMDGGSVPTSCLAMRTTTSPIPSSATTRSTADPEMTICAEASATTRSTAVMATTSSSPMIAWLLRQERTSLTAGRARIRSTTIKRSTSFADARLK